MAYTTPNTGIIRPPLGKRYVHRQVRLTVPTPTATVSETVTIPCPGRLVAVGYGIYTGTSYGAATSGALVIKADTTNGVQVFTDADLSSVPTVVNPVGTTAIDETGAATASTDGYSGGFPVRGGVHVAVTSGTQTEVITVDMWFRLCTYVKMDLVSTSGADGSGQCDRQVRLNGAGVLAAIAVDYQNMPNTTDLIVYADDTSSPALLSIASSNTDIAPSLVGTVGKDEEISASAVTDGTECGNAFKRGLYVTMRQADAYTSGNEKIVMELWIDD